MSSVQYTAGKIFTGISFLSNHFIEIQNENVLRIAPLEHLNKNLPLEDFGKDHFIAPAFIDIQLYGAYERLLSVYPNKETVECIYQYSRKGGAAWCMPTVATNSYAIFFQCIDAVKDYWEKGGKGVLGLQVEGPWISATKKGAHLDQYIFSPTLDEVRELLDYGEGVIKMITLAPEIVAPEIINYIKERGIIVSAGHSNASYEKAINIFDSCAISTATHLYNAMSGLGHRAPGMVGAIFDHSDIRSSVVPDGYHVDFPAIRIAHKIMGNRLFAITDAVTETVSGDYQHHLDGEKYVANGTLSGSALTMGKCLKNLVDKVGISLEEALKMCSLYPAQALNLSKGLLVPGSESKIILLNEQLEVKSVID